MCSGCRWGTLICEISSQRSGTMKMPKYRNADTAELVYIPTMPQCQDAIVSSKRRINGLSKRVKRCWISGSFPSSHTCRVMSRTPDQQLATTLSSNAHNVSFTDRCRHGSRQALVKLSYFLVSHVLVYSSIRHSLLRRNVAMISDIWFSL